ncbi:hypothetical protein [Winogradskya consettensis]|uniref:hypothetical protein n=1 Tax=Winogradskya consettensis TaxID=113560 RepID=UPI001BB37FDA|nr:hypothetical protein [Actinoplanes consettensis]
MGWRGGVLGWLGALVGVGALEGSAELGRADLEALGYGGRGVLTRGTRSRLLERRGWLLDRVGLGWVGDGGDLAAVRG